MTAHSLARHRLHTTRTLRRVRLWLAMALVMLGAIAAGRAHADVVFRPEPRPVHVLPYLEGQGSSVTTSGAPTHAFFRVVNPRGARITVAIESLVLLGPGAQARLGVSRVEVDDRASSPSSISVPANGSVRLTVFFSGVPAARANDRRYVVRLAARIAGTVERADSTISRATRHPWHRR